MYLGPGKPNNLRIKKGSLLYIGIIPTYLACTCLYATYMRLDLLRLLYLGSSKENKERKAIKRFPSAFKAKDKIEKCIIFTLREGKRVQKLKKVLPVKNNFENWRKTSSAKIGRHRLHIQSSKLSYV